MTRGRPAIVFSEKITPLLGCMPDSQVARLAKCSPPTIKAYRVKHNIPAYTRENDVVVSAGVEMEELKAPSSTTQPAQAKKEAELASILTALRNATPKQPDGWLLSSAAYAEILNAVLRLYYDEV